ncbi:MAG: hypothetical protein ACOX7K_05490 [Oscillospiraceae bacterium]
MRHPIEENEMETTQKESSLQWGRNRRGNLMERWPLDAEGEPVAPVFLAHRTSNDMADEMLVNLLEAYGIPTLRQYPNDGEFGRVIMGISGGGADVYVPETEYEAAMELLNGEVIEDDEDS